MFLLKNAKEMNCKLRNVFYSILATSRESGFGVTSLLLASATQELTAELEEKQDVFLSLQDAAELLSLENHPAKQTVEVKEDFLRVR